MKNRKHGEIVGLEIHCEKCNATHIVDFANIAQAAIKGHAQAEIDLIGAGLLSMATALALAVGFSQVDTSIVKPYNLDDLDDLVRKEG